MRRQTVVRLSQTFALLFVASGFSDTLWFGEDHYTPAFTWLVRPRWSLTSPGGEGANKLVVMEVRDDLPDSPHAASIPPNTAATADNEATH